MNIEKILDKITKKIDQVEKLHDKESLLCEEVKDLVEDIRENYVEEEADQTWEKAEPDDLDEDLKI
jgi:cell division protein FtsB